MPVTPPITVALPASTVIGESLAWAAEEAALYFIDVKAPALFRLDPASGKHRQWRVPSDLGGFALLPGHEGALLALRTGIYHLRFSDGEVRRILPPPFDPALLRFNEGACDPSGRFWVGVMFDPADPDAPPQPGSLFSYTEADGLRAEPDEAELHNSMAWTADGGAMFLSHSFKREIYRFPFADGRLGPRVLFAAIPDGEGIPDGAAVDTAGGYWCALHDGGRLRRFHGDGQVDRDIVLPVSKPTMCAFGGADLDELFVTSATEKLTPAQLRGQPLAGSILRLRPGERGIPRRVTVR